MKITITLMEANTLSTHIDLYFTKRKRKKMNFVGEYKKFSGKGVYR